MTRTNSAPVKRARGRWSVVSASVAIAMNSGAATYQIRGTYIESWIRGHCRAAKKATSQWNQRVNRKTEPKQRLSLHWTGSAVFKNKKSETDVGFWKTENQKKNNTTSLGVFFIGSFKHYMTTPIIILDRQPSDIRHVTKCAARRNIYTVHDLFASTHCFAMASQSVYKAVFIYKKGIAHKIMLYGRRTVRSWVWCLSVCPSTVFGSALTQHGPYSGPRLSWGMALWSWYKTVASTAYSMRIASIIVLCRICLYLNYFLSQSQYFF